MVFLFFFTFFAIFLEFYITRRVGTKRNYNFYFPSFSAFCILFWLEMKPQPYFLIFLIFWLFYLNFLLRVGQERNGTITFIFLLSIIFQPILAWNESLMIFFNFYYFFAIFLEFSITRRVGTKWNENFYFLPFLDFSNLLWLEMKP